LALYTVRALSKRIFVHALVNKVRPEAAKQGNALSVQRDETEVWCTSSAGETCDHSVPCSTTLDKNPMGLSVAQQLSDTPG
jgi:hypothetical protein